MLPTGALAEVPLATARPVADLQLLRGAVERRLRQLAPAGTGSDTLSVAVRYGLLAPGKRVRPILTLLAAQELGGAALDALDAGCAIEMVHTASLILDDLPSMDDALTRRGQPCLHVAFGEDVAILSAVTLLSRAYGVAAEARGVPPSIRCGLVSILARAVGTEGLSAGQYRDLRGAAASGRAEAVADANHLKTGMLFVAAVEAAAAVAGASPGDLARMIGFASHLGQAFQLTDDLQDGQGDGSGEDVGKVTVPSLLGPEDTRRRRDAHLAAALDALRPGGVLATFVRVMFAGPPSGAAG